MGLTLFTSLPARSEKVSVATILPEDLVEYETEAASVRKLIEISLGLTTRRLGYQFGSNSPDNWGMDCSGTVQCALAKFGYEKLPRSSWDFYQWVRANGEFVETSAVATTEDPVFSSLKPGDLLFWKGTYTTKDRDPAISHVMIFLGTLKEDGAGVLFGSSSGRRYRGQTIHGVSVFDWEVPNSGSESKFVGYGRIPGLRPAEEESPPVEANALKSLLEKLFKKSEASRP
ncbi:MAG: C40 family peptidase [Verrucomicrobiae bacterium]|nr:C40 family peptidase [Verrucomicrobiae bacterium]